MSDWDTGWELLLIPIAAITLGLVALGVVIGWLIWS